MKKIFLLIIVLGVFALSANAQTPDDSYYVAVGWDNTPRFPIGNVDASPKLLSRVILLSWFWLSVTEKCLMILFGSK